MLFDRGLWLALAAIPVLALPAFASDFRPRLASHAAVYELSLDPRRPPRGIDAATGRIAFETAGNRCEGFSTTFRQVVALQVSGESLVMDTRTTNFEEGDGSFFRFQSQSTQNGQPKENLDGSARRSDGKLAVDMTRPNPLRTEIAVDAIFPTEHLFRIIEAARRGQTILEVPIYDGSEAGAKYFNTTAVIGRRIEPGAGTVEEAARVERLATLARWPVTISYFEAGRDAPTPNYSIAFEVYENGVSRGLVIDYGDFVLRGAMSRLTFQSDGTCDR